jgi:hypothetical protein
MPAEYEALDRQHERLDPQDHRMHEPNRIYRMQNQPRVELTLPDAIRS